MSAQFVALEGDSYEYRTAWAGDGTGVLVIDADGDGNMSRSSEFAFTEWDPTANSDLEAIQSVFDTNGNGLLDAGDDRWSEFRVMVDGQLVTLESLDIESIGLTPTGSGQSFADGSKITGTAVYTKTDGSKGTVGDAILAADSTGFIIEQSSVTNGDGSKTVEIEGYNKTGNLAFRNHIEISASGSTKTTEFDDDGNGTYDRSQTDVITVSSGPQVINPTTIPGPYTPPSNPSDILGTAAGDYLTGTSGNDVIRGGNGADVLYGKDGSDYIIGGDDVSFDEAYYDGVAADYTFTENGDGSVTVAHATKGVDTLVGVEGLLFLGGGRYRMSDLIPSGQTKNVGTGATSWTGTAYRDTILVSSGANITVDGGDGVDTVVFTHDISDYTVQKLGDEIRVVNTVTNEDIQFKNVEYLKFADGSAASIADFMGGVGYVTEGAEVRTISNFAADGSLRDRTTIVTSPENAAVTTKVDQDGDGITDQTQIFVTNVDGSTSTTVTETSKSGSLLGKIVTEAAANGLSKTISIDSTGSGTFELVTTETVMVDGLGGRTKTTENRSDDDSLISAEIIVTSANGRERTISHDRDGDGVFEIYDVSEITDSVSGLSITALESYDAADALLARSISTTSADGLVKALSTDIDGDGLFDVVASDVTLLGTGGGLSQTVQAKGRSGVLLSSSTTNTSADRKTISLATDADGDGHLDSVRSTLIDGAGVSTTTISLLNRDGSLSGKTYEQSSADGLSITRKVDSDGNGTYDLVVTDITGAGTAGSRTQTVTTRSATNTLIGSEITNTSADSLTQTVQRDLNGDGATDRTATTTIVLATDGSRTQTTTETSANATLLGKIEVKTSADRKTTTTKVDSNGDTKFDQTTIHVVNADGSETLTVSDMNANGTLRAKSETTISASGLNVTQKNDINGDGLFDHTRQSVTSINADGSRTTTVSDTARNASLLARTITTVSANGLVVSSDIDADGDGTLEAKRSDVTVLNADGSTTRSVTDRAGNNALIGKVVSTTTYSGLESTVQVDLDGNGTFDRTTNAETALAADGSRTQTVSVRSTNNTLISQSQTVSSAHKDNEVETIDLDGNGVMDERITTTLASNGVTTEVAEIFNSVGALTSKTTWTVGANGLAQSWSHDFDGNGAADQSETSATVLNADGSTTETITRYNATGTAIEKTTIVESANGLVRTVDWAGTGTTTTRSMTDTTVLNANGSTIRTTDYKKASGSLESRTIVTTSADKLVVTTTKDINGNGTVDLTITSVEAADGSVTTTTTGPSGVWSTTSTTTKTETVSADGLSVTVQYGPAANVEPFVTAKWTSQKTLGADGSTVEQFKTYRYTDTSTPALFLADQARTTISGDGLAITREWDLAGDGTYELSQSDQTVLNADGSVVRTVTDSAASTVTGTFVTTTSANGLSVSTSWDKTGTSAISQDSTDVTVLNADGSKTRTITSLRSDSSQLSQHIETTSADGRTVTTQEDIDGVVGVDRSRVRFTSMRADGAIVESLKTYSPGGTLLDSQTSTTSNDKRIVSKERDADGDGEIDQREVTTRAVDGSQTTVITDLNYAGTKTSEVRIVESADGLTTISDWDFDGNGTVDQRRTTTLTDLGSGTFQRRTVDVVGTNGAQLSNSTYVITDDGRYEFTETNVNGDGDDDSWKSVMVNADGSSIEAIDNASDARATTNLIAGDVLWKKAIAYHTIVKTSADGLTSYHYYDYNGNGANPTTNLNPSLSNFEVTGVSKRQIDGSIVTEYEEQTLINGPITSRGSITISADGTVKSLKKDTDNNGTYDYFETATTRIDGSIRHVATEYNTNGTLKQIVTTEVSADGKSTSVLTAIGTSGTGTSTGLGVDYFASASTNDTITGSSGDDYIEGGAGTDQINGGSGNDYIDGGTGNDTMRGNAGNDIYIVDSVGDVIFENSGEGNDTVLSSVTYTIQSTQAENLTLTGTSSINGTGNDGSNTINGNSGTNTLSGRGGDDFIYGGAGDDTVDGGTGEDKMYGDAGNDILRGNNDNDTLAGGAGSDYLNGESGDDWFNYSRGDGADIIDDSASVVTTASTDISAANALGVNATGTVNTWIGGYYWNAATSQLLKRQEAGSETLYFQGGISPDDLSVSWTGAGQDNLLIEVAGVPGDSITLLQQKNVGKVERIQFDGWSSSALLKVAPTAGSTVNGSSEADILFGLAGNETLEAGAGNDHLYGGAGNDYLHGSSGSDRLDGGTGNDTLLGGDNNDILIGGTGDDYHEGGAGDDLYRFRRGDGLDQINDHIAAVTTAGADISAANALNVRSTGITNTWVGGYYWSTSQNKLLKRAEAGSDTLVLEGSIKAEDLSFAWTGVGNDNLMLSIAGGSAGDGLLLEQQKGVGRIEKLQLDGWSSPLNLIVAAAGPSPVQGTETADLVAAVDAGSSLFGNGGDDFLLGGAGNDVSMGGAGNDIIIGRGGNDLSNGQLGDDVYRFRRGDGNDTLDDVTLVATTASADITAATALNVKSGGVINTWVGGYLWDTTTNSLMKRQESGTDTLVLEGISSEDLSFSWTGIGNDNLRIDIAGGSSADSVTLSQQGVSAGHVEKIVLDDLGTRRLGVVGLAGGPLAGSAEADFLVGLAGNDTIAGSAGDDWIRGGLGADTLSGGAGNDTYQVALGDGADTITESGEYGDDDQLVFDEGVDWDELWFSQQGNNLVVSVLGTTDQVTVTDWFSNPGNVVETIKSGDGRVLDHANVASLVSAMAAFQPATSSSSTDILPGDPRLGDPSQMGTVAAAMNSAWT